MTQLLAKDFRQVSFIHISDNGKTPVDSEIYLKRSWSFPKDTLLAIT